TRETLLRPRVLCGDRLRASSTAGTATRDSVRLAQSGRELRTPRQGLSPPAHNPPTTPSSRALPPTARPQKRGLRSSKARGAAPPRSSEPGRSAPLAVPRCQRIRRLPEPGSLSSLSQARCKAMLRCACSSSPAEESSVDRVERLLEHVLVNFRDELEVVLRRRRPVRRPHGERVVQVGDRIKPRARVIVQPRHRTLRDAVAERMLGVGQICELLEQPALAEAEV